MKTISQIAQILGGIIMIHFLFEALETFSQAFSARSHLVDEKVGSFTVLGKHLLLWSSFLNSYIQYFTEDGAFQQQQQQQQQQRRRRRKKQTEIQK